MQTPNAIARFRNTVAAWTGIGGYEHVLYVWADGVVSLRREGRGWQQGPRFRLIPENQLAFDPDPQAPAPSPVPPEFATWIRQWKGDNFRVIVDSGDEEIEVDELPRVGGRDRGKVLDRRLRQRFRDASLTTWVAPLASEGGRLSLRALLPGAPVRGATANPGECTMLASLRQRNSMQLWIDAALAAGARIRAIDSPALLARDQLAALGPRPTALVVSVLPSGLRETLVQDGELRFTRLMPVQLPAAWGSLTGELERTLRFLMMSRGSLRPVIQSGRFPLYVHVDGILAGAGGSAIPDDIEIDGIHIPIVRLATVAPATAGASVRGAVGEALPALGATWALLRRRAAGRAGGYASAEMRRNWRAARSLGSVWAFALASLVLAIAANLGVAYSFVESTDPFMERQLLARIDVTRAQTQSLQRQIAELPVNAREMAGIVDLADQLHSRHVDAPGTLQWVAQALADDPALTIDALGWEPQRALGAAAALAASGSASLAPATPAAAPGTLPAGNGALLGSADAVDSAARAAAATTSTLVRLGGLVDPALSKEAANQRVDALLARLQSACGCTGRVLELPYDPSMDIAYSNSLRAPVQDHPPHFTIELEQASAWRLAAQAQAQAHAQAAGGAAPAPQSVRQSALLPAPSLTQGSPHA